MQNWSGLRAVALSLLLIAGPLAAQVPGKCMVEVADRTGEVGCWHLVSTPLSPLPKASVYWHLYPYPDLANAQSAAKGNPDATALWSHGKAWLAVIAPRDWHAKKDNHGARVALVGPLPVDAGGKYTARYMEAITTPGMKAYVHKHAGPEAFYLLAGTQCVQTTAGNTVSHQGESSVTPGDTSMTLVGLGNDTRRVIVLVLHASDKPWMTMVNWTPTTPCPSV